MRADKESKRLMRPDKEITFQPVQRRSDVHCTGRSQVWQWVRHNVRTAEGQNVTAQWVTALLEEDVSKPVLFLSISSAHWCSVLFAWSDAIM